MSQTARGSSETAELELRIGRSSTGYVLDARFVPAGSDADVEVLRDGTAPLSLDLERFRALNLDLDEYGRALTAALFGDPSSPVHQAFEKARTVTLAVGAPLRVRLFINSNAPELHSLRWETLADPQQQIPLFRGANVIFSRYLGSFYMNPVRLRHRGALRALVMIADVAGAEEAGLAPLEVAAERRRAEAALGPIAATTVLAERGALNLRHLGELLREGSYDILYLVAHGQLSPGSSGMTPYLYLEGAEGVGAWVPGSKLIDRLRDLNVLPTLVALVSCESAGQGSASADDASAVLAALGPAIAELGVPAVLAMQGNLSIATADRLLPAFFSALAADGRVDRALSVARGDLVAIDDECDDWWMPALFTRLRRGQVWTDDPAAAARLQKAEITVGLLRLEQIVAVHGPGFQEHLPRLAAQLRAQLAAPEPDEAEVDRLVAELDAISEAVLAMEFATLARGPEPKLSEPVSPFRGLAAFDKDSAGFFFGREKLVAELSRRLLSSRLLAVVGPSGCGKSSLVLAGLLPAVKQKRPSIIPLVLRPGANPTGRWAETVAPARGRSLLLVVDQFEELFTLCTDEDERRTFLRHVFDFAREQRVVLTMRADFTEEATAYADLREALQEHQELIGPLEPAELRDAMERQAVAGGLVFEPGLSQRIFDEFASEPGAMPLLQFALQELWKRRHGRQLRTEGYERIGGVLKAIALVADELYEKLAPEDKRLLEHLFVLLTRVENDRSDRDRRLTRRRMSLAELVPEDREPAEVQRLLHKLADAKLVVLRRPDGEDEASAEGPIEAEVVHEALIRNWPRLQTWISAALPDSSRYEAVRVAAQEWLQRKRHADWLVHRGQRLAEARQLLRGGRAVSPQMRDYLGECHAADTQGGLALADSQLSLTQSRWAVVVSAFEDSAVLQALWPLILRRMEQMGFRRRDFDFRPGEVCYQWYARHTDGLTKSAQTHWGEIPPVLIYRPDEVLGGWLGRHGTGHGIADSSRVPYYLLIVGKPGPRAEGDENFVPFIFQYQLAIQRAVGRIQFEQLEEYARYARSVVAAETRDVTIPRRVAIFAPRHRLDTATEVSSEQLALPLAARLREPELAERGWSVQSYMASEATRASLEQLLGGPSAPALFSSMTHGMALPLKHEQLVEHQGALVTQDWKGVGPIKREDYFAGEDLPPDARLLGSMAYLFAAYGAGSPVRDDFFFEDGAERPQVAPYDLIARLPQRLLSHPNGGMLAVISHVDRAWTYSITGGEAAKAVITPHYQLIRRLLSSYPVGLAMAALTASYGEYAALLTRELDEIRSGKEEAPGELPRQWTRLHDARNFIILGDPATRLITDAGGDADQRPTLAELGA